MFSDVIDNWNVAEIQGGVRSQRVKNLDSGDTFHISHVEELVKTGDYSTFESTKPKKINRYQISIPITGERESNGKKYTVYQVVVKDKKANKSWIVLHRFSEFLTLNGKLQRLPTFKKVKKSLPSKKLFGRMDTEVIEGRRVNLMEWLQDVVENIEWKDSSSLSLFLEQDHKVTLKPAPLRISKKSKMPSVNDLDGVMSLAKARSKYSSYRSIHRK
eukprot:TRINITY_DN1084_c0_g1_i1.p1 TRINITY_DN1084_c0_g1~~TRINITY_DN1084_c0_g1_i1.p1  ORF type:complete len:216 (+),score=20.22 TRINITY_DN1084_c0_g1_i1:179-826(+)